MIIDAVSERVFLFYMAPYILLFNQVYIYLDYSIVCYAKKKKKKLDV